MSMVNGLVLFRFLNEKSLFIFPAAGPFYVNMTEIPLEDIYVNYSHIIKVGGKWSPKDCVPPYKVI